MHFNSRLFKLIQNNSTFHTYRYSKIILFNLKTLYIYMCTIKKKKNNKTSNMGTSVSFPFLS